MNAEGIVFTYPFVHLYVKSQAVLSQKNVFRMFATILNGV